MMKILAATLLVYALGLLFTAVGSRLAGRCTTWCCALLGLPMWVVGGTVAPFCLALPQLMLAFLAAGMSVTALAVGTALAGAVTNLGLALSVCLLRKRHCAVADRDEFCRKCLLLLAACGVLAVFVRDGELRYTGTGLLMLLFVLFVLGSFWGCSKNATYLEQYVPDADQVSRVEVSLDYPVEYKGDSVRVARQAQKEILSHAESYRENKTDDSTQIIFYYYLKNGKTLSRTYEIVGGNETLSELLFKEENKVDHFMEYLFGTDSDKISKFSTGTLTLNESSENYKDCDFDADTAKKLYQAIYEDAADQKLQKYNLTNALKDPEETGEYSSASIGLDYYHASADWKNVYDRIDDYYGNTGESVETPTTYGGSAYISFGKDCTHIIQTLIDCGVITDVSDIQFQRPEEKTSQ